MNKKIERAAAKLLDDLDIQEVPIPLEKIAEARGIQILSYDLGDNVSGVLVMDNGNVTIGYHVSQSKVRQRFTIAHELGHYELHRSHTGIFIDNNFRIEYRNQNSSTGESKKEQEANAFAAALLMPEKLLIREIEKHDYHLSEEEHIVALAKIFNVSTVAMTYRIANLHLNLRY